MCDRREMVPIPDLLADVRERADTAHPEYGHFLKEDGTTVPAFALDACIVPAVRALWALGIRTIGCCCGHGSGHGVISLETERMAPPQQSRTITVTGGSGVTANGGSA